jgi:hypothetical protein
MADATGEGTSLPAITITEGGVTVRMTPCGWLDLVEIPAALQAATTMPLGTAEEQDAFRAALVEFAARIDSYAAPDSPNLPSRVPAGLMRRLVDRWLGGVRDAAIPPPPAAPSPSQASKPPRAVRRGSRPKSL